MASRPPVDSRYKRPESVLVVIHTRAREVLLLRRREAPHRWQSVTGALRWDERSPAAAAAREIAEETGIRDCSKLRDLAKTHRFEIPPEFRHRYAPGVTENLEHAFTLELPSVPAITINGEEHDEFIWLPPAQALKCVWSWTNREVIATLAAEDCV